MGVKTDASAEDIRKAYRKLSLKYHPDKNPDDEFFAERFREIQEAYDTLNDPERRKLYDSGTVSNIVRPRSAEPPVIKTFTSTKIHVVKGDEVTIKWNTTHADVVKVLPFGLQKAYGERTFRITEFKDGKFVIILHATNSYINKTAVQGITVMEISERQRQKFGKESAETHSGSVKVPPHTLARNKYRKQVIVVLILIAILFYLAAIWVE